VPCACFDHSNAKRAASEKNKKGAAPKPEAWYDPEYKQISKLMEYPEDYESLDSVLKQVYTFSIQNERYVFYNDF